MTLKWFQIDVSILWICPLIDDKLPHNIVKLAVEIMSLWLVISTATNKTLKIVNCHIKMRGKDVEKQL